MHFHRIQESQVLTLHFLRDSFKEYLQEVEVIAPEVEGRITILNEAERIKGVFSFSASPN